MSALSRRMDYQLQRLRDREGTAVLFKGVSYQVETESVSGAEVGEQGLPKTLGPYIASADPRVFIFSPRYFSPSTAVQCPIEGNQLIWHDLRYRVVNTTFEDQDDDTTSVLVYAYREIFDDLVDM